MITKAHARILRAKIVKASESLNDSDALQAVELFDAWGPDIEYEQYKRIRFNGRLYRVRQLHTSQAHYTPDITPALYEEVAEEGQGTKDNPIPYNNNMELIEGLYYTQGGIRYICFRSTGTPVYADLADLVGLFVNIDE